MRKTYSVRSQFLCIFFSPEKKNQNSIFLVGLILFQFMINK